jgi:O-antigen ligase
MTSTKSTWRGRQGKGTVGVRAQRAGAADARWDSFLIAVAAYMLIGVSNLQLLVPFLAPLRPGILVVAASVGLWIASGGRARRLAALRDPTTLWLLALLAWSALSVPFALHRGLASTQVTDVFVRTVLLYAVMVASVRSLRDVERLSLVHLAGVTVYSAYTLLFTQISAATSRVEHIVGNYDPNDYATFAVTGIPFALYFLERRHSLWVRGTAAVGIALMAAGVVLSGSRGGFLALVATGAYIVFRYEAIRLRVRIASLIVAVLAMVGIASDAYWERIGTIFAVQDDYNVTADVGRTKIWERGFAYALEYPVTGVGAGNFPYAEATISPLVDRRSGQVGRFLAPHNTFVQVMAELGVPGFLAFLALLWTSYRGIGPAARRLGRADAVSLAHALRAAMVGLIVGITFLSHAYTAMLYAIVALSVAFAKADRLGAVRLAPLSPPPPGRKSW